MSTIELKSKIDKYKIHFKKVLKKQVLGEKTESSVIVSYTFRTLVHSNL